MDRRDAGRGLDEDLRVRVDAAGGELEGRLVVPRGAVGVVVFAHGSGSSRHSPRNQYVAEVLHDAGLGTLLLDLLTVDEERDRGNVFDVELLAGRLAAALEHVGSRPGSDSWRLGLFGASTGAAAALVTAAREPARVAAVVSRGGRPDLAGRWLADVAAPTLLVVGGADRVVLDLNRTALAALRCEKELAVVTGATHLFEEPGTLAVAAGLARDWFLRHL